MDNHHHHDPPPTADDMLFGLEQAALFHYLARSKATHTAVRSGAWNDPKTWGAVEETVRVPIPIGERIQDGDFVLPDWITFEVVGDEVVFRVQTGGVPGPDSRVWIPEGKVITVGGQAEAEWIRVDGGLRFATDEHTHLNVHTIGVGMAGHFWMGTPESPIPADVSAEVVFTDRGTPADPLQLAGGFISHGSTRVHGAEVTPFGFAESGPTAGATSVKLREKPEGWQVGGRILFPSIAPFDAGREEQQDEVRVITAIHGHTITFADPLKYDHNPETLLDSLRLPVGYLTRNVVMRSENPGNLMSRAHVMSMHTNDGRYEFARFVGLGRTDASRPVTDPVLDADGTVIEGSDANTRARYALHFHIGGDSPEAGQGVIRGVVVEDSKKLAIVVHGSHGAVTGNIVWRVDGSAYFTENGSEIGHFRNNLAVAAMGAGKRDILAEHLSHQFMGGDFGNEGAGLWLQGGGVIVDGLYAYNCHRGIDIEPRTMGSVKFRVSNLADAPRAAVEAMGSHQYGKFIGDSGRVNIAWVPVNINDVTVVGAATAYMQTRGSERVLSPHKITGLRAANIRTGVTQNYTKHMRIQDFVLRGTGGGRVLATHGAGIVDKGIHWINLDARGFAEGIRTQTAGPDGTRIIDSILECSEWHVRGTTTGNQTDVVIEGTQFIGEGVPVVLDRYADREAPEDARFVVNGTSLQFVSPSQNEVERHYDGDGELIKVVRGRGNSD